MLSPLLAIGAICKYFQGNFYESIEINKKAVRVIRGTFKKLIKLAVGDGGGRGTADS